MPILRIMIVLVPATTGHRLMAGKPIEKPHDHNGQSTRQTEVAQVTLEINVDAPAGEEPDSDDACKEEHDALQHEKELPGPLGVIIPVTVIMPATAAVVVRVAVIVAAASGMAVVMVLVFTGSSLRLRRGVRTVTHGWAGFRMGSMAKEQQ